MSENEKKTKQTYNADQYLITALFGADWISAEYKTLADKHRNEPLAVRQIYLCACDKVPIDIMRVASNREPVEDSFIRARQKHLEQKYLNVYVNELSEIKNIAHSLGKEVKNISSSVKHLSDVMPSSEDTHFPSEPDAESDIYLEEVHDEVGSEKSLIHKEQNEDKELLKRDIKIISKENVCDDSLLKKWQKGIRNIFDKKKDPIVFINELAEQNYSDEKIEFIISCFEEGFTEIQIRKFISPKLDIENMKRLKSLYFKGDVKDGT